MVRKAACHRRRLPLRLLLLHCSHVAQLGVQHRQRVALGMLLQELLQACTAEWGSGAGRVRKVAARRVHGRTWRALAAAALF